MTKDTIGHVSSTKPIQSLELESLLQGRISHQVELLLAHPLVLEAFALIREKLPEGHFYHDLEHTRNVTINTIRCALADGLSQRDIELLAIAAAWHDAGFIFQSTKNEPIAAQMARKAMIRRGGYRLQEIADVETAIRDTEVSLDAQRGCMIQNAQGRLSPWLLDGDLSNFGSSDCLAISLRLLREFTGFDVRVAEDLRDQKAVDFLAGTVRMMHAHQFKTTGARALFGAGKVVNFMKMSLLLSQAISGTNQSLQRVWENAQNRDG